MGYKYETHCHTAITSACSRIEPEQLVELYVKNGYKGVFVTDHFLNGNTRVSREGLYADRIEEFCKGYEEVKKCAGNALDVFFGFECSYYGSDILVYGWDKSELKTFSDIDKLDMRTLCDFCLEHGALAVQAHPFRTASYIDHIRLYTNAEGVEAVNTNRTEVCNKLGVYYADILGKIKLCGSDTHSIDQKILGGMEFETPLTSEKDFIERLRHGEGKFVQLQNIFAKS